KMKKILIAEDEKPLAKALVLKLNKEGFAAEAAYDGEEAIEKLNRNQYDLVLLDMVMPKKDGFSVLKEVKEKKIKTAIIVLSNLSQEEEIRQAMALGASDFMIKSNTPLSEVIKKIKRVLEL
ncbi:MAG: two component transcriptional regulator, winged helix family, partial [uncultured bacterium]